MGTAGEIQKNKPLNLFICLIPFFEFGNKLYQPQKRSDIVGKQ